MTLRLTVLLAILVASFTSSWAITQTTTPTPEKSTIRISSNQDFALGDELTTVSQASTSKRALRKLLRQQRRAMKRAARAEGPRPKKPKAGGAGHGLALAAMILGIVGVTLWLYFIPSILAIIFGSVALKRYKEGYHDRKSYAKAGLILGIVGVALPLLIIGIIIASFGFR